jgi:predicted AAA+ superfamily ATPase
LVDQGLQPGIYDPQQAERLDEQRALDDRFALKVFMDMPRKTEYEHMVLSYAQRAGVEVDRDELLAAFKVWCMRHNHDLVGGRTARDFIVDFLPPFVRETSREK